MRREDYNRGGLDYETRDRDYNRDYERDDYGRGFEGRSTFGRDYENRGATGRDFQGRGAYGNNYDRDFDRNFSSRERGFGRDFDEDRGYGYGQSFGYQGQYGFNPTEDNIGQNWGGRNYSSSGYGGNNYRMSGQGYGQNMTGGMYGTQHQRSMYGQNFYGHRNDDEIEREVYDRLDNDWQIPDNAEIHAKVDDGVVTITGEVRNRNAKMAVGNCVWNIPGVEDVHNNINVQSRRRQYGSQRNGSQTGSMSSQSSMSSSSTSSQMGQGMNKGQSQEPSKMK